MPSVPYLACTGKTASKTSRSWTVQNVPALRPYSSSPAAMGGTNHQNGRSSHAPSATVWRACARCKDTVKGNLQWCGIQLKELEAADSDRSQWCSPTLTASTSFEDDRRQRLTAAAYERHQRAFSADITTTELQCPTCSRLCASRLGLHSHQRIHG